MTKKKTRKTSKKVIEKKSENGRPSKFDPKMIKEVDKYLSSGFSKQAITGILDISESTFYDWCDPESVRYNAEFSDTVRVAERRGLALQEAIAIAQSTGQKLKWKLPINPKFKEIDPGQCDRGTNQFLLNTRYHKIYGTKVSVEDNTPFGVLMAAMLKLREDA